MSEKTANGAGAGTAILARLDALEAKVDRLLAHLGADRQVETAAAGVVASLSQTTGEHGDPKIGKPPKNWNGPSFEGCTASECPPDFLEFYANFLDWKARNPRRGKEQYAKYDSLNAQRCRRWAVEIREGRVKQKPREQARDLSPPPIDDDAIGTVWDSGNGPPGDDASDGGLPPPPEYDQPF